MQPIRNSSLMAKILSVYNRLQAGDYENGNGDKRRVSRLTQFIHATLQLLVIYLSLKWCILKHFTNALRKKTAVSTRSAAWNGVTPALKQVAERGSGAFMVTLNTGVPIREVLSWTGFVSMNKWPNCLAWSDRILNLDPGYDSDNRITHCLLGCLTTWRKYAIYPSAVLAVVLLWPRPHTVGALSVDGRRLSVCLSVCLSRTWL